MTGERLARSGRVGLPKGPAWGPAAACPAAGGAWPIPWPVMGIMAALLAGTSVLPAGPATLIVLGSVIVLGIPHGALDGEVARPLLRPRFGRAWFLAFALPYLALSGAVLLAWRAAPEATLAGFLAASVLHFGAEDAGPGRALEAVVRGGLPIALPVLISPAAVAEVFGTVMLTPGRGMPAWLAGGAAVWAVVLPFGLVAMAAARRWRGLAEMMALVLAFSLLPPLTAFALYFVALHAPRHMASLAADPGLAPRVRGMGEAVVRALPVTALTLVLGAGLWPLFPGAAPDRLLALTLQGLAALTLPHLVLERVASGWAAGLSGPGRSVR